MTEQTQPTDAEILDAADDFRSQYKHGGTTFDEFDALDFARAVLAKWGQPAHSGEPVAYLHDDGYWTAAKNDAGRRLNDRLLFAGSPKVAVYTAPQPTQPQAGAVPPAGREPLTDLEIESATGAKIGTPLFLVAKGIVQATESAHGITGGQHGTE